MNKNRLLVNTEKGMVLIFSLVMVAVLSTLTINLSTKMNQEISLLQNSVDELKAEALAQAGINYGIAILKMDEDLQVDWLGEDWAELKELIFEEATVEIGIEDECGKINLNYLGVRSEEEKVLRIEQMLELCDNIGLEYAIVPAIIDWIDADDEVTVLSSVNGEDEGAENDYYTELPFPYPCKNAPFDTIEELLMVKGISKENYYGEEGLGNFVTVFTNGKININTASKEVLQSTLRASISSSKEESAEEVEMIDDTVIDGIIDWRINEPFYELSSLEEFFSKDTVEKISGARLFDVKSSIFTITSKAKVGKIEKKITALVERAYPYIKVRFWKEN
jgi:general secretion pathway protein K